ncbi:CinA family protein [Paroceanicella profunda]|uniref:CinA family protein n=1 Tax=Paroceanicella profunda TaxID=2579971 RepID=A0A5B8FI37_9RHOB|nr:CinA family protein [Paroceanicella profunda]QDL92897.1 CinA family protein [Paroceanicella profunda]
MEEPRARAVLEACRARGLMLATAESCTGGLVSGALTAIPGSSDVVDRGFVTYSYPAKTDMLGVPQAMLAEHGAVSEPVARAMAEGALARSGAGVSVAVTGVAGPGASEAKPEGLVHFAAARHGHPTRHKEIRFGALGRDAVRARSVAAALTLLLEILAEE